MATREISVAIVGDSRLTGEFWLSLLDKTFLDSFLFSLKVGIGSAGLACGRSLWMANYDTGYLLRIDPATRRLTGKVYLGGQPRSVLLAAGAVWVSNQRLDTVIRVRGS